MKPLEYRRSVFFYTIVFFLAVSCLESFAADRICFVQPQRVVTPEGAHNEKFSTYMTDDYFQNAVASFKKEFEFYTKTEIEAELLAIPDFYENYEDGEKLYLGEVIASGNCNMIIFGIVEFWAEDKIYDLTLKAYDPNVHVAPGVSIPPISNQHLDILGELYIQTLFDLFNEFEPLQRNN